MKKIIFSAFVIALLSQTVIADGWGSGAKGAIKGAAEAAIKTITEDALNDFLADEATVNITVKNNTVMVATNEGDWQLAIDSNLASNVLLAHDEIEISNSKIVATNTGSYVIALGSNVGSNEFIGAKIEITNSTITAINKAGKSLFVLSAVGSNVVGQP